MQNLIRKFPLRSFVSQKRSFHCSAVCKDIFNIQDGEDFKKRVLQSKIPVLVDFYANWCGPCKHLGPRLEQIVGKEGSNLHLAKIDVDKHTDLAIEYDVTAVPAVVGMKNGQIVDRFMGLQDDDKIQVLVKKIMGN